MALGYKPRPAEILQIILVCQDFIILLALIWWFWCVESLIAQGDKYWQASENTLTKLSIFVKYV